ncbi:hypothetical protein EGM_19316, partial [Macaca fascicularis]
KIPAHTFLGLPNLEWLDLSKNKLDPRGLHPHAFKLCCGPFTPPQNLMRLKRLNLDGNSLTTVPALPASLQELKQQQPPAGPATQQLPWCGQGLSQLLTLEVEGNQLRDRDISPLAFQPLCSLLYLRLDWNRLRTIPRGLLASLQELHLSTNLIQEVTEGALSHIHSLSVLVLSHNWLQEHQLAPRAWIHLPPQEAGDLSYNRLVHMPSFLPRGLRRLMLHPNHIERIPGVSFLGLHASLAELLLDHNQL